MLNCYYSLDTVLIIIYIIGLICFCIYYIFNPSNIQFIAKSILRWTCLIFIIYTLIMLIVNSLWSFLSMSSKVSTFDFFKEFGIPNIVSLVALIYCLRRIVKNILNKVK